MASAASREPKWSGPVGEGAKRPTPGAGAGSAFNSAPPSALADSAVLVVPVAELAFGEFAALLGLQAERGHRTRLEPLQPDLLAGLLAVAVGALVDAVQRGADLAQKLAFPVPGTQLQAELGLLGGPVAGVGEVGRLVLHVVHGPVDLFHQLAFPGAQYLMEVLQLIGAHVFLAPPRLVRLQPVKRARQHLGAAARALPRGLLLAGFLRRCLPGSLLAGSFLLARRLLAGGLLAGGLFLCHLLLRRSRLRGLFLASRLLLHGFLPGDLLLRRRLLARRGLRLGSGLLAALGLRCLLLCRHHHPPGKARQKRGIIHPIRALKSDISGFF